MRAIRASRDYRAALHELLAYGEAQFGGRVVDTKRALVSKTITELLAAHPAIGIFDRHLDVYVYPVSDTPFVLLYDFDDAEVRIHLIVHRRANRQRLNLTAIEW